MDENTKLKDIVIDASIAAAEILPDEKIVEEIEMYFHLFAQGKLHFIAPTLLKYEITNAMKSSVIQKRTTEKDAKEMLKKFLSLPITYLEVNLNLVLEFALKKNISVYDASYKFLAETNNLKLLTLDKRLASI